MTDCIFCKIIKKEIPADVVYEDDNVLAFKDIQPVAPIHVLIIPKEHIKNVNDLNDSNVECLKHIHLAAQKIAKELNIIESGYRLISNCGEGVGQTVFHMHYHLIGGTKLTNIL